MRKTIFILFIIILFLLGPLGFLGVLGTSVSLKYEVDHPRAMGHETEQLVDHENELERQLMFAWTITVIGPVTAIGALIYKARRMKTFTTNSGGHANRHTKNGN